MTCRDLINMQELSDGLLLCAGEKGLDRKIKWLYFADTMECLTVESIAQRNEFEKWVNGGELMVMTNERLSCNYDLFVKIMENALACDIAGIILNEGQVTPAFIGYANKIGMPLFELSWNLRLINLSHTVLKAIMKEETNDTSLQQLLGQVLVTGYENEAEIINRAAYYEFKLDQPCRVCVVNINGFKKHINAKRLSESDITNTKNSIMQIIKSSFKKHGVKKLASMVNSDVFTFLIPTKEIALKNIQGAILEAGNSVYIKYKLTIRAGLGNEHSHVSQFSESNKEAIKAIKLASATKTNTIVYDELGIMTIFTHIDSDKVLADYAYTILKKLEETDYQTNSELCATLEAYLKNNCNAQNTANCLFIHRNTLRYRLSRIEDILNEKLDDFSFCVKLHNAFKIKSYLSMVNRV